MTKTLNQNSAYSVVHFIMFISLCLFLFIDSCYYRLFSLVLSTILRKFMFLGHLVSLFDILGVREKFRTHFRSQLASLDILRHCILTHLIFPGMQEKLYGEKYVWFIIAWYPNNWFKVKNNRHICTVGQQKEALIGSV